MRGGGKPGGMCASAINLPAAASMETPLLRPKLAAKPTNTLPSPTRNHDEDDDEHQVGCWLVAKAGRGCHHSLLFLLISGGGPHRSGEPERFTTLWKPSKINKI